MEKAGWGRSVSGGPGVVGYTLARLPREAGKVWPSLDRRIVGGFQPSHEKIQSYLPLLTGCRKECWPVMELVEGRVSMLEEGREAMV